MLARGSGRGETVIHRPVWLPGVSGRSQALHAVDALIRDTLAAEAKDLVPGGRRPLRLLDLGCGAGGTAVWLAGHLPGEITGVTLSPGQVCRARKLAQERGRAESCCFVEGDFLDERVLAGLGHGRGKAKFDAAYAVEAFSHAADPKLFFAGVAAQLTPGGFLVLCDDFPSEAATGPSQRGSERRRERWLQAFRRGWHLGPLPGEVETVAGAHAEGLQLIRRMDLSPDLHVRSARARVVYALLRLLPGRGPWISSQRGGAALQVCLRRRWVRYLYLVFRKS